jgi:hypothetical protein
MTNQNYFQNALSWIGIVTICVQCTDPQSSSHQSPSEQLIRMTDQWLDEGQETDPLDGGIINDQALDQAFDQADFQMDMTDHMPSMDMQLVIEDGEMPVCDPNEPPSCEGWRVKACHPDGSRYEVYSCQLGEVCYQSECVSVHPNVVLIVDTSGSMNQIVSDGSNPRTCQGDSCPPWTYPMCDDMAQPYTRLGRVKRSVRSVLMSEDISQVRLALQRYPQTEGIPPLPSLDVSCSTGWYSNHDGISRHFGEHTMSYELLEQTLSEVIPVPMTPEGNTNLPKILEYTDFNEVVETQGDSCTQHRDCPDGFCRNQCRYIRTDEFGSCSNTLGWGINSLGRCVEVTGCECNQGCEGRVFNRLEECEQNCTKSCYVHENHELRATGSTPIGQSLFYAGEYFRHFVVKEGMPCTQDEDCTSQDYLCSDDGTCHDPLGACRPNVIVLLSDGHETDHDDPQDFFNPRIQAKRFHYGLGCESNDGCLNGAQCVDHLCVPPIPPLPERVCKRAGNPCQEDSECDSYTCGLGQSTCPGECIIAGFDYIDAEESLLKNEANHPISLTVHVIDASDQPEGNQLLARIGGGISVPVDFTDPSLLIQQITTFINSKTDNEACR